MIRYVKIALALGILAWIALSSDSLEEYTQPLTRLTLLGLLAAVVAVMLDRLLMAYKWGRLVGAKGPRPNLIDSTKIYCSAMIWGLFLPSTVGADAVRIACFRSRGYSLDLLMSSILVERFIGFLVTTSMGALGLLAIRYIYLNAGFAGEAGALMLASIAVAIAVVLAMARAKWRANWIDRLTHRPLIHKVLTILRKVRSGFLSYREHPGELAIFSLLTILEQITTVLFFWIIAKDLQFDIGFVELGIGVMVGATLSRIPLTPAGLGIFEGAFVLCLGVFGVKPGEALLLALLGRVIQILAWTPWWLWYSASAGAVRPSPAARLEPEE